MSDRYQAISKLFLTCWLVVAVGLSLSAQRTIHGKVTDPTDGQGLIGANVFVNGSSVGTVTDFDGSYSILVPEGFDVISYSYTGYETVEIKLTSSDEINVSLGQGKTLDEVVLVGYGTVKRQDATGSIQSVSAEDFNRGAITGAQELLAGKIPGVVITTDGAPGAGATIRVRGESSLSASNDPLIVIDGVPIENTGVSGGRNPLNVINPNDIETFTVLKDASATAIYGSRASAGVILITTKKGKLDGKMKVGYSGYVSTGSYDKLVDVLQADEYRALVAERYDANHPAQAILGDANTNWQKEIYQSAFGQDHNLYLSGGVAQIPYRVSLGYTNKDGILKTDNFERVTAGINLNPGFLDNTLQFNLSFKSMFTSNQFADRGAIGNALNFDPTQAVHDPESPYGQFTTWYNNNSTTPNSIAPTNPVALLELRDDHSNEKRYITNLSTDYRFSFMPALRANLNLAYDYYHGDGQVIVPTYAAFAYDATNGGGVHNTYDNTRKNSLLEFYLNYKTTINKHGIELLGGYSWQHFEVESAFKNSDAAGTPLKTTQDSLNPAEYFLLSFYGRANYSYNDRFLLTVTLRDDGTSRFAPENRWGLFPAVAVGVKLVENNNSHFNNLKARLGWGITGQQDIGNDYYAYLARYQLGNEFAQYQFGDDYYRTYRPNGYDSHIKWEETETYNLGLDFSIIRDKLSGSLDVYKRLTSDLLNRIPVPAGTNLTNFVTTNVGNMENQGIELGLNVTPIFNSSFSWDFIANVTYNKNKITKLRATDDPAYQGVLTGGIAGGVGSNIQIYSVGYAPKSFYVFEQMYAADGTILEGQFVDRNNDGIVNEMDKYRFEKPAADYTFGLTNNFKLGKFDLSFACRASTGNFVYNNVQTDRGYLGRLYLQTGGSSLWNITRSAIDLNVEDQANLTFSDHFVQPASFIKMDNITLGYSFDHLIGEYLRLAFTLQNVFTITEYDGLDPEIYSGIDNTIYPRPRTFVFGVSVEF